MGVITGGEEKMGRKPVRRTEGRREAKPILEDGRERRRESAEMFGCGCFGVGLYLCLAMVELLEGLFSAGFWLPMELRLVAEVRCW